VLIVEDDRSIVDAVGAAFEFRWPEAGLRSARNGKDGVSLVRQERPDIVILDINLPDMTGFEVLKKIREFSPVPVIILTVRSDDVDMMKGLEAGADDYIIKPFNYMTLLARVKAVLRRSEPPPQGQNRDVTVSGRIKIDFLHQKVISDGKLVRLTPVEYRLLTLFATNKGKTISYQRIAREVWDEDFRGDTENIRSHVRRLRKKLGDTPPKLILNQHGGGYLLQG
jgi:DNA-binding response OmpR family regulator